MYICVLISHFWESTHQENNNGVYVTATVTEIPHVPYICCLVYSHARTVTVCVCVCYCSYVQSVGSQIAVVGNLSFIGNNAENIEGGAVYISAFGQIKLYRGTYISFINNVGRYVGVRWPIYSVSPAI